MKPTWVRWLFAVSGAYDFVIGVAFLVAGPAIFDAGGVPHPNHWAYIQFAALLLVVFGLMFFAVAADPAANRNLIPFGILLKASYVGVCGYYWATTGVPTLFQPFAVIDAVMLVLFAAAYQKMGRKPV
jgi:hypothetical protein